MEQWYIWAGKAVSAAETVAMAGLLETTASWDKKWPVSCYGGVRSPDNDDSLPRSHSHFLFYNFHRHLSLVKVLFVTISLKLYLKNYFLISLPLSLLASLSLICWWWCCCHMYLELLSTAADSENITSGFDEVRCKSHPSLWKTLPTAARSNKDTCFCWWPHRRVLRNRNHEMIIPAVILLFIVSCLNLSVLTDTCMCGNGNKPIPRASVINVFTGDPSEDPVGPGGAVLSLHKCTVLMLMAHRSTWPSIAKSKLYHLWILKKDFWG